MSFALKNRTRKRSGRLVHMRTVQNVKSQLSLTHNGEYSDVPANNLNEGSRMAMLPTIEFLNPAQTIRMPVYSAELAFIKSIEDELKTLNFSVSNKDIILTIIRHLENESDPARSMIYRSALEMVVQRTPDDL